MWVERSNVKLRTNPKRMHTENRKTHGVAGLLLELGEGHPARVLDLRGAYADLVGQRGEPADDVAILYCWW